MQGEMELIEIGTRVGFPALFAVLFWSYIVKVQTKQNDRLRDIEAAVTRIEDMMFVDELDRRRDARRPRSDSEQDEQP